MLYSMTGFGREEGVYENKKYGFEMRSLNGRSLDLNFRLSSQYKNLEIPLRKELASLSRGKIDVVLSVESLQVDRQLPINEKTLKEFMKALQTYAPEAQSIDLLTQALRFPEVTDTVEVKLDKKEEEYCLDLFQKAKSKLLDFRKEEGEVLLLDMKTRIMSIQEKLKTIVPFEKERVAFVRDRLSKVAEEKQINLDMNRYEQEMLYYIEKLDISEEKTRLSQHCIFFLEQMEERESNGRKLNFISQEIGREINTIGSKANHEKIQRLVVEMKDELEKIKEQVQNVL